MALNSAIVRFAPRIERIVKMNNIIRLLAAFCLLTGTAHGDIRYLEDVGVIKSTTIKDFKNLNGVEVRGGKIFVFGNDGVSGRIVEYSLINGELERSGYEAGIKLYSNNSYSISQPSGITYHETMGTFIGNSSNESRELYFFDWNILKDSRRLDWSVLNVIEDDLATFSTQPEFVKYNNEWLIASADSSDQSTIIRLYDPFELQQARKTSDPGVLRFQFIAPPGITHLYWRNQTGELLLAQDSRPSGWRVISIDLKDSIQAEIYRENSVVDLPDRPDRLRGFHYIFGKQAIAVSTGAQGNLSSMSFDFFNLFDIFW